MNSWNNVKAIMKRELGGYFTSPVAYVFLVIFLLLTGFFTFTVGNFFERGEASLVSFFTWHPWLYLFLVPAAGMMGMMGPGSKAPLCPKCKKPLMNAPKAPAAPAPAK